MTINQRKLAGVGIFLLGIAGSLYSYAGIALAASVTNSRIAASVYLITFALSVVVAIVALIGLSRLVRLASSPTPPNEELKPTTSPSSLVE
jgi:hypothetical protein